MEERHQYFAKLASRLECDPEMNWGLLPAFSALDGGGLLSMKGQDILFFRISIAN